MSLGRGPFYRTTDLPGDLTAGLTVYFAALPLCLGIALASGAPLLAGLVAGIVGGIVVGFLSDSEVSVSGPAAGLAVIVADAVRSSGSYEAFLVAVVLAGVLQVLLGLLKAGRLSSFFPNSVVRGMLAGIGIVIILKQIPHALGHDRSYQLDFEFNQLADRENTLSEIYRALIAISPGALIISLISLLVLIGWDQLGRRHVRFFRYAPSALVIVLLGIGFNQLFKFVMPAWYLGQAREHMVQIPVATSGRNFLSILNAPDFSVLANGHIYTIAVTIAVVASLEALLNLEAADRIDPLRRVSSGNQELLAQGVGNILSGLVGGLPVTAVIVRTKANVLGGVRSRLSTILNGVLLLLSLLLTGSVLNYIPLSCLAALLLVVGYQLASPRLFSAVYREGMNQFIPFLVTVVVIVFTNLLIGIAIGAAVGLLFVLYSNSQASFRVIRDGNNVLIKFQRDIYFLSKPRLKEVLRSLKSGDSVLVDGRYATFIDNDIYTLLLDFTKTAQTLGIGYELRHITNPQRNTPSYATF